MNNKSESNVLFENKCYKQFNSVRNCSVLEGKNYS